MLKVKSYEQIQQFTTQIRSLRSGFVTNFYWDANKHPYWLDEGTLLVEGGDKCHLLLHHNEGFVNLYYIATSFDAIASSVSMMNVGADLVIDLVCKGEGEIERECFKSIGFKPYNHLFRMSHVGLMDQPDWIADPNVQYGKVCDAMLVAEALHAHFDPLCEQLPSLKELEDYAVRQQMLVMKDGNKLQGFLIAEKNGMTWYLRYWYTSPDYRNQGIGAKLLRTSLVQASETKRQLFWVIADNTNAIKRYEHYGFKRENMNDYVMIKRKLI